jgi:hypothetical protein
MIQGTTMEDGLVFSELHQKSKILKEKVAERHIDPSIPIAPIHLPIHPPIPDLQQKSQEKMEKKMEKKMSQTFPLTLAWVQKNKLCLPDLWCDMFKLERLLYGSHLNFEVECKNDVLRGFSLDVELTALHDRSPTLYNCIAYSIAKCWSQVNIQEQVRMAHLFTKELFGHVAFFCDESDNDDDGVTKKPPVLKRQATPKHGLQLQVGHTDSITEADFYSDEFNP